MCLCVCGVCGVCMYVHVYVCVCVRVCVHNNYVCADMCVALITPEVIPFIKISSVIP